MRYRMLDANRDYTFGRGQRNFYRDQPEAVGQACETRLALIQGEFWLDLTDGTPYSTEVLGTNTQGLRDPAIQLRVLETPGVRIMSGYSSQVTNRAFTVSAVLDTIYGQVALQDFQPAPITVG